MMCRQSHVECHQNVLFCCLKASQDNYSNPIILDQQIHHTVVYDLLSKINEIVVSTKFNVNLHCC